MATEAAIRRTESGAVAGQYHPIFSGRNIQVTQAGGPIRALGYRKPITVKMTEDQAKRFDQLVNAGFDPTRALEMVGGAAAGALLGAAAGAIAGGEAGAIVGPEGAIIGSIVGGLAGLIGGSFFGGGPKIVTRTIPGRAPQPAPHHATPEGSTPTIRAQTPSGKPAALKQNYRVLDLTHLGPAEQIGAVPSQAVEFPHHLPTKGGVVAEGAIQLEEAIRKILAGQSFESLTTPEKAALAGAVLGGLTGPQDAVVGAGVGSIAAQLGTSIEDVFARLRNALGIQPSPTAPTIPTPAPQLNPQPQFQPQPLNIPQPQPQNPPPQPPPPHFPEPGHQPQFQPEPPPPPQFPPPDHQPQQFPQPQNPPPPSGDCTTPESPLGQLSRLLWNCPTFQQEMQDKLTVVQRPGKPPQLAIKEPVCLCCDSAEDMQAWVESGGIRGNCVQTRGADAEMLGTHPGGTNG